jgi:hypothetical protein
MFANTYLRQVYAAAVAGLSYMILGDSLDNHLKDKVVFARLLVSQLVEQENNLTYADFWFSTGTYRLFSNLFTDYNSRGKEALVRNCNCLIISF